ncbi:ABC transporter ATP-binding protein [candidate division KSB1 bacterium]|nr:ABC transporter ATP-binding protein [candidate division KSB1 bacterium]
MEFSGKTDLDATAPLLEVENLKVHFFLDEGTVNAVNGVSFKIRRGETVGLVGESGCGKSVTSQAILRIVPPPGKIVGGNIWLNQIQANGQVTRRDLVKLKADGAMIRAIRGREIAMIFQEPMTSLSPAYTIGNQIIEAVILHQKLSRAAARRDTIELLNRVGIPQPERRIDEYPFELSGGLRQRAMIAMALSCKPGLLIADEPTTALDVTIQAQILELLRRLQAEFTMAILLITHDLGVIAEMAQQVMVMYLGHLVEQADVQTIFHQPAHPYTRALLKSIPQLNQQPGERLGFIEGTVPDALEIVAGCSFYSRCKESNPARCPVNAPAPPPLVEISPGHKVACWLYS